MANPPPRLFYRKPSNPATRDILCLLAYEAFVGLIEFLYESMPGYTIVYALAGFILSSYVHVAYVLLAILAVSIPLATGIPMPLQALFVAQLTVITYLALKNRLVCDPTQNTPRGKFLSKHGHVLRAPFLVTAIGFFVTACVVQGPLIRPLVCCIILLIARSKLPRPKHATPLAFKTIVINSTIFAVSTLITLSLFEAGVRRLLHVTPYKFGLHSPHPNAIYTLRPNTSGQLKIALKDGDSRSYDVQQSSQGLRDKLRGPKRPGEFRILMLGDSYTWGAGLEQEETIPRQFESYMRSEFPGLDVTAINAGVGGYSTWQEYIFFLERGLGLQPDLVILQLYSANDVPDSLIQFDEYLESYNYEWRWRIRQQRLTYRIFPSLEEAVRKRSVAYHYLLNNTQHWLSIAHWSTYYRWNINSDSYRMPQLADREENIEINMLEDYPMLSKAWNTLESDIASIAKECVNRDILFLMYDIPSAVSAVDKIWDIVMTLPNVVPEEYDRTRGEARAHAIAQRNEWPFIKLLDAFRNHPSTEDLYFTKDRHLNPDGARFVAGKLTAYLKTHEKEFSLTN